MVNKTTRRDFIKTSAAVTGIGFWVAAGVSAQESKSPNEKLGVASVGVGGKGSGDVEHAAFFGNIVGLCDVDKGTLASAKSKYEKAETFTDFRDMLEKLDKSIDLVTVSTPDHMHAPAALMAMRMKKHMYVQKPLTRTIYEARKMAEVAQETGVCTQMGNQGSALNTSREAVAQVRAGVVGKIKEVHVWTNRPIWPQGIPSETMKTFTEATEKARIRLTKEEREGLSAAEQEKKIEAKRKEIIDAKQKEIDNQLANLDWDLWIGAAKYRDFFPGLYHTFAWRGWWDFGSGALGDMACHTFNMPYYACDLRNPVSVQAITSGHNGDSFPSRSKIIYEFPANDFRPAVKAIWYDGGNLPDASVFEEAGITKKPNISGAIVMGDKGTVYTEDDYCGTCEYIKCEKLPNVTFRKNSHIDSNDNDLAQKLELYEAIQKNDPSLCISGYAKNGGPLTETILLGNLAVWAASKPNVMGEKIEWDPINLKVKNNLETSGVKERIKPEYRECKGKGYRLD
ncbi:MAG: Gfo/Idh/MocA family oxidoreductase [Planctomycetaceae bacterium]|nr:Gfo/Idh/MocA family oxidoreductase [Planctomycetaceae bacterium]